MLNETMPLISIIVPAYNIAEYLPRCLDSILNQTYKNLEIIVNADEMLDRGKVEFADIAKEVITRISGKNLKKEGITPENVGGKQFGHILLERQAKLIKEIEEK